MPLDELISQRITGILPFNELRVDAEIWRESHGQHKQHRHLHALATHRPGIVTGLEVLVSPKDPTKLIVAPGIAVDSEGRTILVHSPTPFAFEERGTWYLIAVYEDILDQKSEVKVGSGTKYYRLVEACQVIKTKDLPDAPFVELARVERSKADKSIREAANELDPGEDELNLLYRPHAFPYIFADGSFGEVPYAPKTPAQSWKPNRGGLIALIREANTHGFHAEFAGPLSLKSGKSADPLVAYMSGAGDFQPLAGAQFDALQLYLENGGVLFGDASKGNEAFTKAFEDLTKKLGGKLAKVSKGHPLLSTHRVFSSPPAGGQDSGAVTIDDEKGIILSTYDYGRAWIGEVSKPDSADARNRIRDSIEFGLNIFAYGAKRRRNIELSRLI